MRIGHYNYHKMQKRNNEILEEHKHALNGLESSVRTFVGETGKLTRLLARREKQLKRVLRTARRDGDALRDIAQWLIGNHNLSQAGMIRMLYQLIYTTSKGTDTITFHDALDNPKITIENKS